MLIIILNEIRHTTRDDIDVVADGKFTESVTNLIGILSHHADVQE